MEQTNQFTRIGVKTGGVWALTLVAVRTGQSKIFGHCLALMLAGTDVIDLKPQRKGELREAAVFAAEICALPNGPG